MGAAAFPPDLLARYRMDRLLASGGYGSVYLAHHRELDRPAAVKLLHADHQSDAEQVRRFVAEARVAAQLDHPHIVRLLDCGVGEAEGTPSPWIAYALAEGESVASRLERGPLGVDTALAVAAQVASALAAAHARGVVHRDIKPENVLEVGAARFALCDFGIALWNDALRVRTASGVILGTPDYIAPEIISGDPATPASDIYALGAMLFRMLTGTCPFARSSLAATLSAHIHDPIPLADLIRQGVSAELADVVLRAMAKRPADRFASAEQMARALERIRESEGPVPPAAPTPAARNPAARTNASPPTVRVSVAHPPERSAAVRSRVAGVVAGVTLLAILVAVASRVGRSRVGPPQVVVVAPHAAAASPPAEDPAPASASPASASPASASPASASPASASPASASPASASPAPASPAPASPGVASFTPASFPPAVPSPAHLASGSVRVWSWRHGPPPPPGPPPEELRAPPPVSDRQAFDTWLTDVGSILGVPGSGRSLRGVQATGWCLRAIAHASPDERHTPLLDTVLATIASRFAGAVKHCLRNAVAVETDGSKGTLREELEILGEGLMSAPLRAHTAWTLAEFVRRLRESGTPPAEQAVEHAIANWPPGAPANDWVHGYLEAWHHHARNSHAEELDAFERALATFDGSLVTMSASPALDESLAVWSWLSLHAVQCREREPAARVAFAARYRVRPGYARHAERLFDVSSGSLAIAFPVDRVQRELDFPSLSNAKVDPWVEFLEADRNQNDPADLLLNSKVIHTARWEQTKATVDPAMALSTLRYLRDPGWRPEPADAAALHGIVQMAATELLSRSQRVCLDLPDVELKSEVERMPHASSLRGLSILISHARRLLRRVGHDQFGAEPAANVRRAATLLAERARVHAVQRVHALEHELRAARGRAR